jgi:hypothetical protein
MHRFRMIGRWDLERAVAENPTALLRSDRIVGKHDTPHWDDLTFQFAPRSLLYASETCLDGYSSSAAEAEAMVRNFADRCKAAADPGGDCCLLHQVCREEQHLHAILDASNYMLDAMLALHHGPQAPGQHHELLQHLCLRKQGFVLLEGPPGSGKKAYMRHLAFELRESHRFYFISPPVTRILSDDAFLRYWINERSRHPGKTFALILEDCEFLLSAAETSRQKALSALLYLTSGLLAGFLRLQIFCTINGQGSVLHPALLEPGTTIAHRTFKQRDVERSAQATVHPELPSPVRR